MVSWKLSSEPVIFLYTIIFTINYTVLPQLVLEKLCLRQNGNNRTACQELESLSEDIYEEASKWWCYLLLCSLVPTVFSVLIWGPVTDIVGRKRAMIFVPLINATRSLVYLINSYYIEAHPGFLIFGSFLSCFYGEFQGVVALCYAYIADVTTDQLGHRTMRMAFIEASLFFSGIPAGLLSGYLLHVIGFIPVFILTCGINVLILLYILCCLPNDRSDRSFKNSSASIECSSSEKKKENSNYQNNNQSCSHALNPCNYIRKVIHVVTKPNTRNVVLPSLGAFGFAVCAVLGELIVQTLYLKNRPFLLTPDMIGYYSAVQSGIRGIGVILFTQLSFHVFHLSDYAMIYVGLSSAVICYLLIGIARSVTVVFLVNIAGFAIPVATTTLRSVVTKYVSKDDYGAVLASIEAMDALGAVATNVISLWMYGMTLHVYTGIVYFSLSAFAFIALVITLVTFCAMRLNSDVVEI